MIDLTGEMAGTAPTPLRVLIYLSIAESPADSEATARALAESVVGPNRDRGITGLLLANGRSFMQLLEGAPAAVDAVFNAITRDPRHRAVEPVLDQVAMRRTFPDHAMLGLDLVSSPVERRASIAALLPAHAAGDIRTMLLGFSVFD